MTYGTTQNKRLSQVLEDRKTKDCKKKEDGDFSSVNLSGLGQGPVVGSYEHCNEFLGSRKVEDFLTTWEQGISYWTSEFCVMTMHLFIQHCWLKKNNIKARALNLLDMGLVWCYVPKTKNSTKKPDLKSLEHIQSHMTTVERASTEWYPVR